MIAALITASLTACQPSGGEGALQESADELYATGERAFSAVLEETAGVQRLLSDGEWRVDAYGALPVECELESGGPGYEFRVDRALVGADFDIRSVPGDIVAQLRSAGWETAGVAQERLLDDGSSSAVLQAWISPGGKLKRVYLSFYEATGTVLLSAASVCFPGDQWELYRQVFPDDSSLVQPLYPGVEVPGAPVKFKFSVADGTAKRLLIE